MELFTSTVFSVISHVTGPQGTLPTLPAVASPFPRPLPTGSHTHCIRKVSPNTSVHISGMPQRSNSCWPLFQTHDPVCPKSSLDELQLIYTISTSYGERRLKRVYSPHMLWYKDNLLSGAGSFYTNNNIKNYKCNCSKNLLSISHVPDVPLS